MFLIVPGGRRGRQTREPPTHGRSPARRRGRSPRRHGHRHRTTGPPDPPDRRPTSVVRDGPPGRRPPWWSRRGVGPVRRCRVRPESARRAMQHAETTSPTARRERGRCFSRSLRGTPSSGARAVRGRCAASGRRSSLADRAAARLTLGLSVGRCAALLHRAVSAVHRRCAARRSWSYELVAARLFVRSACLAAAFAAQSRLNTASVLPTRMMSPASSVFFGTLWPLT